MYSPGAPSQVSSYPTSLVGGGEDPSQRMAQTIAGYIDTKTPSLHPALAVESTFNSESMRYEEKDERRYLKP